MAGKARKAFRAAEKRVEKYPSARERAARGEPGRGETLAANAPPAALRMVKARTRRNVFLRRMRQACVLGCDIAIGTVGAQGALVWDGQQLYEPRPPKIARCCADGRSLGAKSD